jgi:hypothetical protein
MSLSRLRIPWLKAYLEEELGEDAELAVGALMQNTVMVPPKKMRSTILQLLERQAPTEDVKELSAWIQQCRPSLLPLYCGD